METDIISRKMMLVKYAYRNEICIYILQDCHISRLIQLLCKEQKCLCYHHIRVSALPY